MLYYYYYSFDNEFLVEWTDAWTLKEYVLDLIAKRQTDSSEFKILLKIYGREKLEQIYKEAKETKKPPVIAH